MSVYPSLRARDETETSTTPFSTVVNHPARAQYKKKTPSRHHLSQSRRTHTRGVRVQEENDTKMPIRSASRRTSSLLRIWPRCGGSVGGWRDQPYPSDRSPSSACAAPPAAKSRPLPLVRARVCVCVCVCVFRDCLIIEYPVHN